MIETGKVKEYLLARHCSQGKSETLSLSYVFSCRMLWVVAVAVVDFLPGPQSQDGGRGSIP